MSRPGKRRHYFRKKQARSKIVMPGSVPARYIAFFDGCCEPYNPGGTAGYGAVIFDRHQLGAGDNPEFGTRVFEKSGFIPPEPTTSNNIAEYLAVNMILDWLLEHGADQTATLFGDSRLVICQLWGWPLGSKRWAIHGVDSDKPKGFYADTAVLARDKVAKLPKAKGFWIPRHLNSIADDLSKAHLRDQGVQFRIQPEDEKEPPAPTPLTMEALREYWS